MDLILCSIFVVLLGIVLNVSMAFIFQLAKKTKYENIPGSTGWPIIGESLKFLYAGYKDKPESFIRERMSKYSSVIFKTSIAGSEMAVPCGAGGHKMVFSNEKNILGIWWPSTVTNIMLSKGSSMGEEGKVRDFLSPFLKPEALKGYVPIMDDMIKNFMDNKLATNEVIHAFPVFKKLAFSLSCKLFLAVEDPAQIDKLSANFDSITEGLLSVPINFPGTTFNRAIKAANRIRDEIYPIIKLRRLDQQIKPYTYKLDLISFLVSASSTEKNEIFLMDIADAILSLLVGSHDTISSTMSFVIYYLADHPLVYDQVLKEQNEIKKCKQTGEFLNWDDINKMKYSRRVINEVMRLAPAVPGAFRQVNHDFTYAGFTIPKGRKIFWSVHSTHKDPKYFENPEEFNPSRFEGKGPAPYSFVPFGAGRHMCPGNEYARVEILIFIHNLVTRFRWNKVVQNEKMIYNPVLIPTQGLPVCMMPHDN